MFYYRFANWLNGEATTCAAMHGKYSSLDPIAVMNTNLSVAAASVSFIYDPLEVDLSKQTSEETKKLHYITAGWPQLQRSTLLYQLRFRVAADTSCCSSISPNKQLKHQSVPSTAAFLFFFFCSDCEYSSVWVMTEVTGAHELYHDYITCCTIRHKF